MRAYLVACLAIFVIGAVGYFGVNSIQEPSGIAYTTDGVRISPDWSWRRPTSQPAAKSTMKIPGAPAEMVESCDVRTSYQWIFVDFGDPKGEPKVCSDSQ